MAILGPLLAVNSDRIGRLVVRPARLARLRNRLGGRRAVAAAAAAEAAEAEADAAAAARRAERDRQFAEEFALVEAAGSQERENESPETPSEPRTSSIDTPTERPERPVRQRDPEY